MKNFEDIKNLWQQQQVTPQLDVNEMLAVVRKNARSIKRRLLKQSIILLVLFFYMIWIASIFHISKLQIASLIMIDMLILMFGIPRFVHYIKLKKINFSDEPLKVLKQSIAFHRSLKWLDTTGYYIYAALLVIAFVLYSYEPWLRMSLTWKWGYGTIFIGWFAFAVFFLAKRMRKKQNRQMEEIIEKLKQQVKNLKY